MKFLAFILAIYIFALNLAPCADNDSSGIDSNIEITQGFNDDHQHQESDFCSPFCICQCCHINATHLQIVEVKLEIISISTQVFFYLDGLEINYSSSVLQPPQA